MKKNLLLLILVLYQLTAQAQISISLPKDLVTEKRLKAYVDSVLNRQSATPTTPVVVVPVTPPASGQAPCKAGPEIKSIFDITSTSSHVQFHGEGVNGLDFQIKNTGSLVVSQGAITPTSNVITVPYAALVDGEYTLILSGNTCTGSDSRKFTIKSNTGAITPPVVYPARGDIPLVGTFSTIAGGRKFTFSKTHNFTLKFNSDGSISDATPGINTSSTPNRLDEKTLFYQIGYYPLCADGDAQMRYKPLQNTYLPDGAYSIWQVKCDAGKFPDLKSYVSQINGWDVEKGLNMFNAKLEVINLTVRTLDNPGIPDWLQATRTYQMGKYGQDMPLRNDKSYGLFRSTYPDVSAAQHHQKGIHTALQFGEDRNQPSTVKTFEWTWNGLPLYTNQQLYDYGRGMVQHYGMDKTSLITDQIPENTQGTDQTIFDRMYHFYAGLMDHFKEADPQIDKAQTGLYGPYGQDLYTGFFSHGVLESYPRSVIAESLDSHRFDELEVSTRSWRNTLNSYFRSGQINVRNMNYDLYLYNGQTTYVPYEIMYAWERAMTATKSYEGKDRQSKMIVYSTSVSQSMVGGASAPYGLEYSNPGEVIPFKNGELRGSFSMAANVSEYYDLGFWSTIIPNGVIMWSTNNGGVDSTKIDHYFGDEQTPGRNMTWSSTGNSPVNYVPSQNGAPANDKTGIPDQMYTMPDDVAFTGYQDARKLLGYAEKVYYASYTSSRKSFNAVSGTAGNHVNGFGPLNIGVGINIKDAIDKKSGLAIFGEGKEGKIAIYYNGFLSKDEYEENVKLSHNGQVITIPGKVYGRKTYYAILK